MDEFQPLSPEETRNKLETVSSSFCLAKWKQVTMHLHTGEGHSCHHVIPHPIPTEAALASPQLLHNTPFKKQMREQMMTGKRPSECSYCWKMEDRGQVSDRILKSSEEWAAPYFDEVRAAGSKGNIYPSYVEISFDSICNFKCMYCSPSYSTAWMKEIEQFGHYPTSRSYNKLSSLKKLGLMPLPEDERQQVIQTFWKWWPDLAPHLRHFRITGGEPLLAKETWQTLDWLIENPMPNLNLALNTNMSLGTTKRTELIDRITRLKGKIKSFSLYTSVDSVGKQAEYIRYGLNFERFQENVEEILKQVPWRIQLCYMITVNCLSLPGLKGLLEIVLRQREQNPQHELWLDLPYLQRPQHLSMELLPKEFGRYLEDAVKFAQSHPSHRISQGFYDSDLRKIERLMGFFQNSNPNILLKSIMRRDFYRMIQETDKRRKLDFHATFPEYSEFLESCRKLSYI